MTYHNFVKGERLHEPGVPDEWHRVRAACGRCGEERAVYWAVEMRNLNLGPCDAAAGPSSRLRRFFRRREVTA